MTMNARVSFKENVTDKAKEFRVVLGILEIFAISSDAVVTTRINPRSFYEE